MDDTALIKAEIERIRHHQDLQKKVNDENTKILIEIKTALVGSEMNDNKGIVSQIREVNNRVEDLEDFKSEVNVYVKQLKFTIGALVIALISIFVKLFNLK